MTIDTDSEAFFTTVRQFGWELKLRIDTNGPREAGLLAWARHQLRLIHCRDLGSDTDPILRATLEALLTLGNDDSHKGWVDELLEQLAVSTQDEPTFAP